MTTRRHAQQSGQEQEWYSARNCLIPIAAWVIAATQLVFAGTSGEEVLWDLSALEGARFEKQICEENYPEFKDRNEVAFRASPYFQIIGEELITVTTTGDLRQKLLGALPELRAGIQERYTRLQPKSLKSFCSTYAASLEQATQNEAAQQKKP
ncbi:MAG: hypothetical protein HHJ12_12110 [Glaciimonas sp.]|nr:hypothetical protein [Glaciimonas sp.]